MLETFTNWVSTLWFENIADTKTRKKYLPMMPQYIKGSLYYAINIVFNFHLYEEPRLFYRTSVQPSKQIDNISVC